MRTQISPLHKKLNTLVKKLDAVECAILIGVIHARCNEIIENEEEVRKQMENYIISANLFLNTMCKIQNQLN